MSERNELFAFKSTHQAVFAWWDESVAARERFNAEVKAFLAEHGMGRQAVTLAGWSIHVVGLETTEADYSDGPPEGWRIVESKHGFSWIQPYRRAKWQKAIHDAMPSMPEARESMPGFEHRIFFGGLPGFFVHDDVAYANIGNADQMDTEVWDPIPLSEFYAAREAHEAEAAS